MDSSTVILIIFICFIILSTSIISCIILLNKINNPVKKSPGTTYDIVKESNILAAYSNYL